MYTERIASCLRALIFAAFHNPMRKQGIAIVAIAKNESEYIREWVAFHKAVGFDRIILYDNDSTDNMRDKIKCFISDGFVIYETISGEGLQLKTYNLALKKYGKRYRYCAFIDCDEFLFPIDNTKDLCGLLDSYVAKDYHIGGWAVNWCLYGSSGHEKKPNGGVIENFTWRAQLPDGQGNQCIKTIVIPDRVKYFNHPHYPIYKRGFYNVDFSGRVVPDWRNRIVDYVGFRINHYFTKSKQEWIERRSMKRADGYGYRTMEEFYSHDNNDVEDYSALYYKYEMDDLLRNC